MAKILGLILADLSPIDEAELKEKCLLVPFGLGGDLTEEDVRNKLLEIRDDKLGSEVHLYMSHDKVVIFKTRTLPADLM